MLRKNLFESLNLYNDLVDIADSTQHLCRIHVTLVPIGAGLIVLRTLFSPHLGRSTPPFLHQVLGEPPYKHLLSDKIRA